MPPALDAPMGLVDPLGDSGIHTQVLVAPPNSEICGDIYL